MHGIWLSLGAIAPNYSIFSVFRLTFFRFEQESASFVKKPCVLRTNLVLLRKLSLHCERDCVENSIERVFNDCLWTISHQSNLVYFRKFYSPIMWQQWIFLSIFCTQLFGRLNFPVTNLGYRSFRVNCIKLNAKTTFFCWRWYFYFIANMTKKFNSKCDVMCCVALLLLYSFAFSDFHFIAVGLIIFVLFCFLLCIYQCFDFFFRFIDQSNITCVCVCDFHPKWMVKPFLVFGSYVWHLKKKISAPFKWKTHEMWQVCLKWTRKARFFIKLLFDIDWIFLCFSMIRYGSMIMQKKKNREETKS